MTSTDRRRFLQTGALGFGAGFLGPAAAAAEGGAQVARRRVEAASRRVRMKGDGLGLTASDQAQLMTWLAGEGRIDHSLLGFVERFGDAVIVWEAFIDQIVQHDAFTVARGAGGTNLFVLRVGDADATGSRRRLGEREVDPGAPPAGGKSVVGVNETWNRLTADDLAGRFVSALEL